MASYNDQKEFHDKYHIFVLPVPIEHCGFSDCKQVVDFMKQMTRPKKEVCPNCKGALIGPICHFTYNTWDCTECGAHLDGRVITPEIIYLG